MLENHSEKIRVLLRTHTYTSFNTRTLYTVNRALQYLCCCTVIKNARTYRETAIGNITKKFSSYRSLCRRSFYPVPLSRKALFPSKSDEGVLVYIDLWQKIRYFTIYTIVTM